MTSPAPTKPVPGTTSGITTGTTTSTSSTTTPEWLTVRACATWLRVNPRLVYRLATTDSTFPAVKVGGAVRIRASRLDRWLAAHHPAKRRNGGRGHGQPLSPTTEPPTDQGEREATTLCAAEMALTNRAEARQEGA